MQGYKYVAEGNVRHVTFLQNTLEEERTCSLVRLLPIAWL